LMHLPLATKDKVLQIVSEGEFLGDSAPTTFSASAPFAGRVIAGPESGYVGVSSGRYLFSFEMTEVSL
jgi:hypothetical protein